jgi:hypothetical protein
MAYAVQGVLLGKASSGASRVGEEYFEFSPKFYIGFKQRLQLMQAILYL